MRHQSKQTLQGHLEIAEMLEADGVIFHIGSVGVGGDRQQGIDNIIKYMSSVLDKTQSANLILENGSGGGGKLGTHIEDIHEIVQGVQSDRVQVCIDTAHIYAGGVLDFKKTSIDSFFKHWRSMMKKELITVLHINDSKTEFGSYLDRHENIGQGCIGIKGFEYLASHTYFSGVPWILEVPGFEGQGPDKQNLEILKKL